MVTGAFSCRAPAFVLLRLATAHRQMAFPPIAFSSRVRRNSSLSLPIILRRSRSLTPATLVPSTPHTFVLCCPVLPVDHPCFCRKHRFHILRADHPSKHQGVPLWPLYAQITGLTLVGCCKSSHMSPCLYFKDLLPPSLLLLAITFSHPHTLRPQERCHGGKFLLNLSSISAFLQARCLRVVLPHSRKDQGPS